MNFNIKTESHFKLGKYTFLVLLIIFTIKTNGQNSPPQFINTDIPNFGKHTT